MKQFNFLILILYFCVLVAGSLFFYYKYYPQVLDPTYPGQRQISGSGSQTVFFTTNNDLYRIFASNSIDRLGAQRLELLSKDTVFSNLTFGDKNLIFLDDQKDQSAIVRIDPQTKTKTILISKDTPGLNNFNTFSKPVISPDKKSLIFRAATGGKEVLLTLDLTQSRVKNLTNKLDLDQIYDYAWLDKTNLIIAGAKSEKYALLKFNLNNFKTEIIKQGNYRMEQLHLSGVYLFYIKKQIINGKNTADLINLNLETKKEKGISLVGENNIINNYDLSQNAEFVIMEIRNTSDNTSNLSIAKFDGSNLLQLTTDGASSLPVFMTNSTEFVYWKKGDGLYKTSANQFKPVKFINLLNNVEQIFAWR